MPGELEKMSEESSRLGTIKQALEAIRNGSFVVVMDDEGRENEGDLVMAAQFANPSLLSFLVRHTNGILCCPMSEKRAEELQFPRMVAKNEDPNQTNFTVSADLLGEGVTTGASCDDRAKSAHAFADPARKAHHFHRPGHLFPLVAKPGGTLERGGHTEATVDLCTLAGVEQVGLICELMHPDGTMRRFDACCDFAQLYGLPIITVQQIIEYRQNEPVPVAPFLPCSPEAPPRMELSERLTLSATCDLPVQTLSLEGVREEATFQMHVFRDILTDQEHIALVYGTVAGGEEVYTRVHSECMTGNTLNSLRCDCGAQFDVALNIIAKRGSGVMLYVVGHEGRGIGLTSKIRAYRLQQQGLDTYQANKALHYPDDCRDYSVPRAVLRKLQVKSVTLLTNNPIKVSEFAEFGCNGQVSRVAVTIPPTEHSAAYLQAKSHREARGFGEQSTPTVTLEPQDATLMARALQLAERGRCSAPPNPHVGCVLTDSSGRIIGEGYHVRAGTAHAEVRALEDAAARGEPTEGCTAYVTLEPCHHQGRTGPCDMALLQAGVARVVVAQVDPDKRVESEGIATLRAAGVQVVVGVLGEEAQASLRAYLHHRQTGMPYVVLKTALSIDGKIGCSDGSSQWITGPAARAQAHKLRARSQAILVGSGTALADSPQLTARVEAMGSLNDEEQIEFSESRASPLLRVVLDSRGRVTTGPLVEDLSNPTLIFTTDAAPTATLEQWQSQGLQPLPMGSAREVGSGYIVLEGELELRQVLAELGQRGVHQLMVEGGAQVHSSMLKEGLVNEAEIYYGAKMLGGSATPWTQLPIADTITEAVEMELVELQQFESDICARYLMVPH